MSEPAVSKRTGRTLLLVGVALALLIAIGRLGSTALVEVLWHRSVGYDGVFWTRIGLRALGIAFVGLAATAAIFWNLRVVASTMGRLRIRRKFGNLEFVEQLPKRYLSWMIFGSAIRIPFGGGPRPKKRQERRPD